MQPIVVLYLLWVLWFLTWLAVAITGDPRPHKPRGPFLFVYRLALLAATLLLFTITPWPGLDVQYRFWDHELSQTAGWALTAVAGVGFLLAWWGTVSRLIAGKQQIGVADRIPFLRHPIHLGLIVAALATAAMFGRPSSSAGAVLFIVVFLVKILVDERKVDEPADFTERVSMLRPALKPSQEAHTAVQHVAEPQQAEPLVEQPAGTPKPAPEPVSEPQVKPVQLKLSLDVVEKSNSSALSEADLKP